MTTKKKSFKRYLPLIIGATILLVAIGVIVHMISKMEDKPEKKERQIQKITITKPPPPPPPPPKVEKPPEPEQEKIQEAKPEEPKEAPTPDDTPPASLAIDAEGGAGDGFGLVGHKGGQSMLGSGGGGDPYAWYGKILKNEIEDILSEHEELRQKGYSAIVKFWVEPDGTVKRFELAKGSNDPEIDELLNRLLAKYKKVNEPLPPGMGQPLELRIISRI